MRRTMRVLTALMLVRSSRSDLKNSTKKSRTRSMRTMMKMTIQRKRQKPNRTISKSFRSCQALRARPSRR